MAKLPDKFDLAGNAPKKSGRSYLSADDFAAPNRIAAQGMKAVAGGINKLGQMSLEAAQEQDALDLLRADAFHRVGMMETERSFDTDPDFDKFDGRFGAHAKSITDEAAGMIRNPRAREKWQIRANTENETFRGRVLNHGTNLARQKKIVDVENIIGDYQKVYDAAGDDMGKRDAALGDIDNAITAAERSGLVDPRTGAALRQKHLGASLEGYYQNLIENGQADRALEELEKIQTNPDYRGQNGPPAIRYNNPGAMWPGPSSKKFGATESVTLNDGQGNKIAVFPDAVSGAAAQFDLLSTKYKGKTLASALSMWSGGNSVGAYIDVLERETGLKSSTKLTPELLADPKIAIPVAKAMALQEAGKPYPLSDDEWSMAFDMANRSDAEPTRVADASGAVPRRSPNYYRHLSTDRLKALKFEARRAGINDAKTGIEGAIEKIKKGGQPEADAQGRTAFDRARRFLQPNQITKMEQDIREAEMYRDAVLPLANLSDAKDDDGISDVARHLDKFRPAMDDSDEDYAIKSRVIEDAEKAWNKLKKERDQDPAGSKSIDGSDEVAYAKKMIRKTQVEDAAVVIDEAGQVVVQDGVTDIGPTDQGKFRTLFDARLEAQALRSVPFDKRRVISKTEAGTLLGFEDTTDMPPDELMSKLQSAADKAEALYGAEYGKRAMKEAIGFVVKGRDQKMVASGLISQMVGGELPPVEDYRAAQMMADMDAFGRAFKSGFDPFMGDAARPMIAPSRAGDAAAVATYASREAVKTPYPEEIEELRKRPDQWQKFDRRYGKGAAARALATSGTPAR